MFTEPLDLIVVEEPTKAFLPARPGLTSGEGGDGSDDDHGG